MAKSDSLFQLISSLNSSEKRLFKMYVTTHSGGKEVAYLDLFDAYVKLPMFSEAALQKKLPKSYPIKNLAQQKKYLKDLILKCMREIDTNRAEDTVNELMREQVFLGKKNLIKEQWKKLEKAKEIADKYELFSRSIEILDAQMKYLIERDFNSSLEFMGVYRQEKSDNLAKIAMLSELSIIKNQIFQLLRRYKKNINQEQLERADKLIAGFKKEEVLAHQSFQLNMILYNILGNHADLHQRKQEVVENRHAMVLLCQKYPWMVESDTKRYLISYFNYVSSLFSAGDFPRMKDELDALQAFKLSNSNDRGEFFQNITLYKILYWLNTGKLDEAEKEKEVIEKGVKTYRNKINASSLLSIYFNYALAFFCNENFEECVNWLERIDTVKKDVRRDLKAFAKVLRVVCHFELKNYLLIESLVRSVRRSTDLRKPYQSILSVVLALSNKGRDENACVEKLKEELEEEGSFVGEDLINLWIQSRISSSSLNRLYLESIS